MLVTAATAQGSVVAWWSGPDGSVTTPLPSNSYREKETEKMYATRFELVDPFTSMSDQQLADKYRKMRAEGKKVFDELRRRGYTVSSTSYDIKISKTETINL
jgi:hypothetical protein